MCRFPSDIYATIVSFLSQINCDPYIHLLSTKLLTAEQASFHGVATYTQNNRAFITSASKRLDHVVGLALMMIDDSDKTMVNIVSAIKRNVCVAVFLAITHDRARCIFTTGYIMSKIGPFMKTIMSHVSIEKYHDISLMVNKYYKRSGYSAQNNHSYINRTEADDAIIMSCRFPRHAKLHNVDEIYKRHGVDIAALITPPTIHISHIMPSANINRLAVSPTGLIYTKNEDTIPSCRIIDEIVEYWLLMGKDVIDVLNDWLPLYKKYSSERLDSFIMYLYNYVKHPPSCETAELKEYLIHPRVSKNNTIDFEGSTLEDAVAMRYDAVLRKFKHPPSYVRLARGTVDPCTDREDMDT